MDTMQATEWPLPTLSQSRSDLGGLQMRLSQRLQGQDRMLDTTVTCSELHVLQHMAPLVVHSELELAWDVHGMCKTVQ
jgi:hypothetical protein